MKKGRHRRYEEARALKRGPDLDIEALFTDLEGEPIVQSAIVHQDENTDIESDLGDEDLDDYDNDDVESDAADSGGSSEFE
ncbi:MAG: hypothetical protein WCJ04_03885 [Actinomycetes bacterium]